jgi:phosphoglucosamine mutase
MEVLPQALVNARVANHKKENYMEYPEIAAAIKALESRFAGEGRVLIRPSGTEPLIRIMIEGREQEKINALVLECAETLKNLLN